MLHKLTSITEQHAIARWRCCAHSKIPLFAILKIITFTIYRNVHDAASQSTSNTVNVYTMAVWCALIAALCQVLLWKVFLENNSLLVVGLV